MAYNRRGPGDWASRERTHFSHRVWMLPVCFPLALSLGFGPAMLRAGECLQLGGSPERNNVSAAEGLPVEWEPGEFDRDGHPLPGTPGENILWTARLGSETYGTPVVTESRIFCATNNGAGYLDRLPPEEDLGCLLAFSRDGGRFLWQFSVPVLDDSGINWPEQGICSTPLVEGDRLWVITNRCEVVCLDTEGFRDGENDGPFRDEEVVAENEADVIWRFDMRQQWGVHPLYMTSSSVTSLGDVLFVCTSNGADEQGRLPAPEAPSFAALDKHTGRVFWTSNLPDGNILEGQWSSPAAAVLGGVPQVIFAGGDGWVYSFRADKTADPPQLLWKCDTNPKASVFKKGGLGDRNYPIAAPVIADGRVFVSTACDPQMGQGQADLWCIDPTRRGDVSAELVVGADGHPVPPQRDRAVDPDAGQRVVANPNSAVIWHYRGQDLDGDGELAYEETFHRTLGMPVVADGLLVIGDFSGIVHCLDAETGELLWYYDVFASLWGSPLVADGKVYLGDEEGDVAVFRLLAEHQLLAENSMFESVYTAPVALDGVLYLATRNHLWAIAETER